MTNTDGSKRTAGSNQPDEELKGPRKPREEAQRRQWSELTTGQQAAVIGIQQWIQAFYDQPSCAQESIDKRPPRIDNWRLSNIILIDGDRGSGKSTVLLFLLNLWKRRFWCGPHSAQDTLGLLKEDRTPANAPIAAALEAASVIPLQPLDLQPLPHRASILTWLARRLYDVLEELSSGNMAAKGLSCPGPPWAGGSDQETQAQKCWRSFLDAASRWNGNLTERKGHLDPEDYALELDQAVRSHLDLSTRWGELVDALVEDAQAAYASQLQSKRPILLLPIDDADMNPHLCVRLLDFVRMLWHRRLVVVLTGESRLFQEVLRYHYLGALKEPLGTCLERPESRDLFGAEETAARLASAKYDSVVPKEHRFELREPELEEIRKQISKQISSSPAQIVNSLTGRTLKSLQELKISENGGAPKKLGDYLNEHTLPAILPNLRGLVDLDAWLARSPTAEEAVGHLWQLTIQQPWLKDEQRRSLADVVGLRNRDHLWVDTTGLKVDIKSHVTYFQRTSAGGRLKVRRFRSFAIDLLQSSSDESRAISAALVLATNVANDESAPNVDSNRLGDGYCYSYPAVEAAWPKNGSPSVDESFPWPMPRWRPYSKWLSFGGRWNEFLDKWEITAKEDVPSMLAIRFCQLVHDVQTGFCEEVPNNLCELGERLAAWADDKNQTSNRGRDLDAQAFKDWATTMAILLAAPESGLSQIDARLLLDSWGAKFPSEKSNQNSVRKLAVIERHERAVWTLNCAKEETQEKLSRYDKIDPQWSHLMGEGIPAKSSSPNGH